MYYSELRDRIRKSYQMKHECITRPRHVIGLRVNQLCSTQLYVTIVHFLKLMRLVLKHVPLERWIQLMIAGFKTVNLVWVNKVTMIGYTWLFVYESARRYEGRTNVAPVPYIIKSYVSSGTRTLDVDHSSPTRYHCAMLLHYSYRGKFA